MTASEPKRRYFDNAATSFPKPPAVVEAMVRYAAELGASPGRGTYRESRESAALLARCRQRIATLISAESADRIVFTLNCTDALNLAIKGVVRNRLRQARGPVRVVTTESDHNSVLRPTRALRDEGVEVVRVPIDPSSGLVDPGRIAASINPDTVLVAAVHASNVTGAIQPVAEIARLCRRRGVFFLVDAAQSAGHVPIDVRGIGADLMAFPGHKGLLGPLGTGVLYIRPGVEGEMVTLREGGTGSASESDVQPDEMPQRFECGSHNTIGLAGLSEGVAWLLDRGVAEVRRHELGLIREMLAGLDGLPQLTVLGPTEPESRVGVLSLVHDELEPADLAAILETRFGVLARAGLHCAPLVHSATGTTARGGATRLSIGPFLDVDDCRYACGAIREICHQLRGAAV